MGSEMCIRDRLRAFPYLLAMWLLIIVVAACPDFVMFLPRLLM